MESAPSCTSLCPPLAQWGLPTLLQPQPAFAEGSSWVEKKAEVLLRSKCKERVASHPWSRIPTGQYFGVDPFLNIAISMC